MLLVKELGVIYFFVKLYKIGRLLGFSSFIRNIYCGIDKCSTFVKCSYACTEWSFLIHPIAWMLSLMCLNRCFDKARPHRSWDRKWCSGYCWQSCHSSEQRLHSCEMPWPAANSGEDSSCWGHQDGGGVLQKTPVLQVIVTYSANINNFAFNMKI